MERAAAVAGERRVIPKTSSSGNRRGGRISEASNLCQSTAVIGIPPLRHSASDKKMLLPHYITAFNVHQLRERRRRRDARCNMEWIWGGWGACRATKRLAINLPQLLCRFKG